MTITIEKFNRTVHNLADVKGLLAMAMGRPSIKKLAYLIGEFYASDSRSIFVAESNERIIGIIGTDYTDKPQGFITHIAVHPYVRKKGTGRQLIEHVIQTLELTTVEAETDQDAVDFYTACKFESREIESQYKGIRRFRCMKSLAVSTQQR